ncbi:MAG: SDR family NAD(P)-dependent oxidoreductase [Deltaproteobacteria bacterium]|nr:SDR family NAD(P)-dependent oxidoreductase [Deltaproteobacteria bacterium]MBI3387762.1 SDR family NAD(P)-dependent oxidoreductase [Deltaproteobacteria bacterium]
MGLLDGKVAVVTGAGQGLGREHSLALAKEGAKVVVNDIGTSVAGEGKDQTPAQKVVDEIKAAGGNAAANYEDIATWDGARRTIDQAYDTFGRLDIVVNNAGVLRDRMNFNMAEDEFDLVLRVHCKGHFAMTRHACVRWREQAKKGSSVYGRVINTSSEAGLMGSAGNSNYAMAKAAIAALTISIAREMGKYGVTCNYIAPRARTRMTDTMPNHDMFAKPESGFDVFHPAWPAQLVTFLASEQAGDINGQGFIVWGGEVALVKGWHQVAQISKPGDALSARDLIARKDELFGKLSRQPEYM